MKKLVSLLLTLMLLVSMCAGALAEQEKTTIRFVVDFSEDSAMGAEQHALLRQFQEANPDIDLQIELSMDTDIKVKIRAEAAAGNLPHVFAYWTTLSNARFLHDGDCVMETEKILEASKVWTRDMFPQAIWDSTTLNGVTRGLPVIGSRGFFFVNKTLYDQFGLTIPKTYEELREQAKVFQENGIIPLAAGFKAGNPAHQWYSILFNQLENGTEEMNAMMSGGKFQTGSGNAEYIARIIQEDMELGIYPQDVMNGDWTTQEELFYSGKAAAMYSLSFQLMDCPADFVENIEFASVPMLPDAAVDPSTFYHLGPQSGFFVSKNAFATEAEKDATMRLVDFLGSKEWLTSTAKYQELALNVDLGEDFYPVLAQKMREYQKGMNTVPAMFGVVPDSTAFNSFKSSLEEVCASLITPEEFAENVQATLDEIEFE